MLPRACHHLFIQPVSKTDLLARRIRRRKQERFDGPEKFFESAIMLNYGTFDLSQTAGQHLGVTREKAVLEARERLGNSAEIGEELTSGAKAYSYFQLFAARLKSCPDTERSRVSGGVSLSSACRAGTIQSVALSIVANSKLAKVEPVACTFL